MVTWYTKDKVDALVASAAASGGSSSASGLVSWAPNTAYTTGKYVVAPDGSIIQAKSNFTSGSTYDPTKWNVIISADGSAYNRYELVLRPERFGAVGDGTTDDTAAIQATFAAVPATGAHVVLSKKYAVTAGTTCNNPVIVTGLGGSDSATTTMVSGLLTATDNIDVLSFTGTNGPVILRDFGVLWTGTAGAATAGTGIKFTGGGGGDFSILQNVHVTGFYDGVAYLTGFYFHVSDSHFQDFVRSGVYINNSEGVDKGDMGFSNCVFWKRISAVAGGNGIMWAGGGGLRVQNCKFNANSVYLNDCISLNVGAGSTSVFLFTGNSYENYTGAGVRLTSGTGGRVSKMVVSASEFLGRSAGTAITVDGTNATSISDISIAANVFTTPTALVLTKCSNIAVVGNSGAGVGTPIVQSSVSGLVLAGNTWPVGANVPDTYQWDRVFAPPSTDDTPTITMATTSAITSGTAVYPTADYYGDTHFRYDGTVDVTTAGTNLVKAIQPSASSDGAVYNIVPEFVTSQGCNNVDIMFTLNAAGSTCGVRITVNGKLVQLPMKWFTTTASSVQYIRLSFPSAKSRSIRVEATNTSNFGGVVVPTGETVTRPARDVRKRAVLIGDSYLAGANSNTTTDPATNGASSFETFGNYVAKLLGCDSIINLGVGGTGWMAVGTHTTFGSRVADVIAAGPHIVIAAGSRNDNGSSANSVYNAVVSALTQLGDVPVIEVTGIEDAGSSSGTSATSLNEAVKQGARAAGRRFNDTLNVVTTALKNTADTVHPSIIGHQVLAQAFYANLDKAFIDETIAGVVGARTSIDVTLAASPVGATTVGGTITLTATLSQARAGKVTFSANGTVLGTSTVSGTTATYTTSPLPIGTYSFTARFSPSNPMSTKSSSAAPITGYTVAASLGITDSFNRADGPIGVSDNSKTWTQAGSGTGTWQTVSNKAANPTITTGTSYVYADAGTPNGTLTCTIGGTTVNAAFFVLRVNSVNNLLRLSVQSSQLVLQQTVSSTTTTLYTGSGGGWAAGDVISVVMSGDTFTVKKNGTNVAGLTNVTISQFNTSTQFGMAVSSTGAGVTFDDFSVA